SARLLSSPSVLRMTTSSGTRFSGGVFGFLPKMIPAGAVDARAVTSTGINNNRYRIAALPRADHPDTDRIRANLFVSVSSDRLAPDGEIGECETTGGAGVNRRGAKAAHPRPSSLRS